MQTKEDGAKAVKSIIPMSLKNDETSQLKAGYLSYLYAGFGVYEALDRVGCRFKDLTKWRDSDPELVSLEDGLKDPETRRQIRKEVLQTRWSRNWMDLLDYDAQVLNRIMGRERDESGDEVPYTDNDYKYLLRMRGTYSTGQMELLDKISGAGSGLNVRDLILLNVNGDINATQGEGKAVQSQDSGQQAEWHKVSDSVELQEGNAEEVNP